MENKYENVKFMKEISAIYWIYPDMVEATDMNLLKVKNERIIIILLGRVE